MIVVMASPVSKHHYLGSACVRP